MTREALAAALLALLAGPALAFGADRNKVVYTCGTELAPGPRTEGRLNTWHQSALSFTPVIRGARAIQISYKSITRVEFGPAPGHRAET